MPNKSYTELYLKIFNLTYIQLKSTKSAQQGFKSAARKQFYNWKNE